MPLVVPEVETLLAEKPITDEALLEAADAAMDACTPIDDTRAGARYRKVMVRNLSRIALKDVWSKLGGEEVGG